MIVIGLTGEAEHGKSTVANHLVAAHGFTKLSFAGPLKEMLRTLNPIVGLDPWAGGPIRLSTAYEICGGDEKVLKGSVYGPEVRRLWQTLGTECVRSLDDTFWTRIAQQSITDPEGQYVFDDVRFPNEAATVRDIGPTWDAFWHNTALWNVFRPGHSGKAGDHDSERLAGKLGEDCVLVNSGTVEDLQKRVDSQMARLS